MNLAMHSFWGVDCPVLTLSRTIRGCRTADIYSKITKQTPTHTRTRTLDAGNAGGTPRGSLREVVYAQKARRRKRRSVWQLGECRWPRVTLVCTVLSCLRFSCKHLRTGDARDIRIVALVPLLRRVAFHVRDVVTYAASTSAESRKRAARVLRLRRAGPGRRDKRKERCAGKD